MKKELTKNEELVLKAYGIHLLHEYKETALFMSFVSKECGFNVRRYVRSLARKGYLELIRGLIDDNGMLAGSGYGLTEEGFIYLNKNYPDL